MSVYALLVAVDAYPPPLTPLRGCRADVAEMAELLRARTEAVNLRTLLDAGATRAAFVDAVGGHLGAAGPDDAALLVFSGHGSRAPAAPGGAEADGWDETLVLVDSRGPGGWDLTDGELGALLTDVVRRAGHVLVVLDCCHAGTGTRSPLRERYVPPDDRPRPPGTYLPGAYSPGAPVRGGPRRSGARGHVLLAACRADETAKEVPGTAGDRGAFSAALGAALRGGALAYRDVHRAAADAVGRRVERQHPQLEATDPDELDRSFLGGRITPVPFSFTLTRRDGEWVVDGGAVHGIVGPDDGGPTRFAVFRPSGTGMGALVASAAVLRAGPASAVVAPTVELEPAALYRAVVVATPMAPLAVALGAGCAAVEAALAGSGTVRVAPAGAAQVRVAAVAGGYRLTDAPTGRVLAADLTGPAAQARLVAALEHVARWHRVAALRNEATHLPAGAVTATLLADGAAATDGALTLTQDAGPSAFVLELVNTTAVPVWCAVLDLTDTFGVYADAVPEGALALPPGGTARLDLHGEVPDAARAAGVRSVRDLLKVVVATVEFDPRPLHQGDLDVTVARGSGGGPGGTPPPDLLDGLLVPIVTRGFSLDGAAAAPDWRTEDRYVTVVRP